MPFNSNEWNRRKMWRTFIGYPAGGFVILQAVDFFISRFGWNPKFLPVSLALLLCGFPLFLIWNWFHGEEGKQSFEKIEKLAYAVLIAITSIVVIITWNRSLSESGQMTILKEISFNSIAVLPLANLSNDPDQQFFIDGIAQDILIHLSSIPDLTVISFNSSKNYSSDKMNDREIGQALGSRHLLQGSVQRADNILRIRVQLVDAVDNNQIWAKFYDRPLKDIFRIQSEVAKSISESLALNLSSENSKKIDAVPTLSLEAYGEYSLGRYEWNKRTKEGLSNALFHFNKALKIDSNFVQAVSGISQTYMTIAESSIFSEFEMNYENGKFYAEKALGMDPNNADALTSLGLYFSAWGLDFEKAIHYHQRAISQQPGNATAHQWLAEASIAKGDIANARIEIDVAKKLDPDSRVIKMVEYIVLIVEGEFDKGIEYGEELLQKYPDYENLKSNLTSGYAYKKDEFNLLRIRELMDLEISKSYANMMLYDITLNSKYLDSIKAMKDKSIDSMKPIFQELVDIAILRNGNDIPAIIKNFEEGLFKKRTIHPISAQCFPIRKVMFYHPDFQDMMERRNMIFHYRGD